MLICTNKALALYLVLASTVTCMTCPTFIFFQNMIAPLFKKSKLITLQ